jgi:glutaredoxin 3
MTTIRLYTKTSCAYCAQTKQLLQRKGLAYEEMDLGSDPHAEAELIAQTGFRTVPQIFINERFVGGFTELAKLGALGELDRVTQVLPGMESQVVPSGST